MPLPHIRDPLLDLFFKYSSQFYPSLSRQRVKERVETETLSAFLANCACALGARFAQPPLSNTLVMSHTSSDPTHQPGMVGSAAAAPFVAKAQELIIPLLHLPTTDVCTGLLYLAWASYGQNSEAGFWQFGGMAFRMAIDLGIHEDTTIFESVAHITRTRLLFWNLFITDRVIAFVTGRPVSIPDDIVEIPLPDDGNLFPDPARNTAEYLQSGIEIVEPSPFVQLVKLMVICGRISDVLNGRRGRARTLVTKVENLVERLGTLQVELVQFISALPPSLQWSAENFKHHADRGHGVSPLETELTSGDLPRSASLGKRRRGIRLPPRAAQITYRHGDPIEPKYGAKHVLVAGVVEADMRVHGVCRPGGQCELCE